MNTNTHEFETTDIPLNKLLAWNENVRTTATDQGIEELAASIASVGLLRSLVVKKAPRGKFSVIAGKRRLLALSQLVDTGTISPRMEIPCRVVIHDADLTEISLAENVQREPMHREGACGVVVSIGFHGEPEFCYGLLRREDEAELANTTATADDFPMPASISGPKEEEQPSAYSAPLVEALTMHKTAAIAAELTQQPRIALAAVVHALLLSEFGLDLHLYRSNSCLQLSSNRVDLREAQSSSAFTSLEEQRKDWFSKLPNESSDLWKLCLEQDQDTVLRLLAFCAARSLNGVKTKADVDGRGRLKHSNDLAIALDIDMKKWFGPTAENFFGKVSKARITEALTEAGKSPRADTARLKKAELAAFAEKEIQGTGWLPEPVRISAVEDEDDGCSLKNESEDKLEKEGAQ